MSVGRFVLVFLVVTAFIVLASRCAQADHAPFEAGKVYLLPSIFVCKSPETLVESQEIYMEQGLPPMQAFMRSKAREQECLPYRGAALYLDTEQKWKHEGFVFHLLKLGTRNGAIRYTVVGRKAHDVGA